MQNKRSITRKIVKTVVAISAATVVNRALSSKEEDDNYADKAMVGIGSAVVGAMVGDMAGNYVMKQIDDIFGVEEQETASTPEN